MQQVAEPWLVLRLSNSPFLLGLDSFMRFVVAHFGIRTALLANGVLGMACHTALIGRARRAASLARRLR
jgi:hypothetical protein